MAPLVQRKTVQLPFATRDMQGESIQAFLEKDNGSSAAHNAKGWQAPNRMPSIQICSTEATDIRRGKLGRRDPADRRPPVSANDCSIGLEVEPLGRDQPFAVNAVPSQVVDKHQRRNPHTHFHEGLCRRRKIHEQNFILTSCIL
jgi:hypothetical protein